MPTCPRTSFPTASLRLAACLLAVSPWTACKKPVPDPFAEALCGAEFQGEGDLPRAAVAGALSDIATKDQLTLKITRYSEGPFDYQRFTLSEVLRRHIVPADPARSKVFLEPGLWSLIETPAAKEASAAVAQHLRSGRKPVNPIPCEDR